MKIFISILTIILFSCTKKNYNPKYTIQNSIHEKSDLELDTSQFSILLDSVHNTETAFDLDYQWYVKLKIENNYFENVKRKIKATSYFNLISHQYDSKVYSVNTTKVKGIWYTDSTRFVFRENSMKSNTEYIQMFLDTSTHILEFELVHL